MTVRVGVVMDPITSINYKKDSTLAMLWAAQARNWQLFYIEQPDLYLEQGVARARMAPLTVFHDPDHWFKLDKTMCKAVGAEAAVCVNDLGQLF